MYICYINPVRSAQRTQHAVIRKNPSVKGFTQIEPHIEHTVSSFSFVNNFFAKSPLCLAGSM